MSTEYRRDFLKVASLLGGSFILSACGPNFTAEPKETPTDIITPTATPLPNINTPTPEIPLLQPNATPTPENPEPVMSHVENKSGWDITLDGLTFILAATAYGIPPEASNYKFNFTFLSDKYIGDPKNDVQVYIDDNNVGVCRIAIGHYEDEFRNKSTNIPVNWQDVDWLSVRTSESLLFCYASIAYRRGITQMDLSRAIAQNYIDSFFQETYPPLITRFQRPSEELTPTSPPPSIPGQST